MVCVTRKEENQLAVLNFKCAVTGMDGSAKTLAGRLQEGANPSLAKMLSQY